MKSLNFALYWIGSNQQLRVVTNYIILLVYYEYKTKYLNKNNSKTKSLNLDFYTSKFTGEWPQ